MKEEIVQAKTLTNEEKQQLFGWGTDIFGGDVQNLSWRPMELHFILKINGKAIGHLGLIKEQLVIGDKHFDIAGVGDIITIPEMRGKGIAQKLMNHAINFFIKEWKVDVGVLFCFERLVPFYQSLGWEMANNPVYVLQPTEQIKFPNQLMIYISEGKKWPAGTIEISSLPW